MAEEKNTKKPIVLVILDGWGEWEIDKGNPLKKARLPIISNLDKHYPKTLLQASGLAVGLPWEVRGNSEVGHQTIGSGQIVFQFLPAISASIEDSSFFKNEALLGACNWAIENKSALHVWGLLSDGGVHSHIEHLYALLEMAKKNNVPEVFIHAITDGRDTHPQSAKKYIELLQTKIKEIGIGKIATLGGRYYAMDRNNNWDRIQKAFLAMTVGKGIKDNNIKDAIDTQYAKGVFDEYLEPVVLIDEAGAPLGLIKDNDAVICFNFRKDRSREMTKAFTVLDFPEFKNIVRPKNLKCVCFARYEESLPCDVAFIPGEITVRLGEVISQAGKKQLRISETEKYAHVTYFFNGAIEAPYAGEDRILIPSKNVPTYASVPEMSAKEITDKVLEVLPTEQYDFILINYANSDMVGHTGNFKAGVMAVEFVDLCLGRLIDAVLKAGGELLISADHGNVEEMVDVVTGEPDTKHSKNPVPCWYVSKDYFSAKQNSNAKEIGGLLVDLAPTVLELLDLPKPKEMIGHSLLQYLRPEKEE